MLKHSRTLLVIALAALTTLGACKTTSFTNSKPLSAYNYQAVDTITTRARPALTRETPMLVGTIGNINNVETSSALGRTISEQLSARLAQKGYKVAELKFRQGISIQHGGLDPAKSGEYLLSRDVAEIAGEHKAVAALTGTYSVGAQNVLVNLRLIDIRSGEIMTAYDYTLPKTADIVAMLNNGSNNSTTTGAFFSGISSFE